MNRHDDVTPRVPAPDVVLAGAYRSGTTTLRRLLAQHPALFVPRLREPSYFSFDEGQPPPHLLTGASDPFGRQRINQRSDYERLFDAADRTQLMCDCSPEYLRAPASFARIAAERPDAKVIVSLRHPVDRLVSDWQMCRRDGVEHLSLGDALAAVGQRAERGEFGGHYVLTSQYSQQLPALLAAFPEEQRLVLIHEEWVGDNARLRAQIADFLGIEPFPDTASDHVANRSGEPANPVVAAAFALRRRLAPSLGGRIPAGVQHHVDQLLQKGLANEVTAVDRRRAEQLLASEIEATESVLDRRIPRWHDT